MHKKGLERFEIVQKGYNDEKNRVIMKYTKSKKQKLKDAISKITKF